MSKKEIITILAISVLLVGSASALYVDANTKKSDYIKIDGTDYTIDQLSLIAGQKTIESNSQMFTGISLEDIIKNTMADCHSCNKYTFIGADGYQKTVEWKNIKNGVLTDDKMSVFSDLPKAFRVKDIVEIEVS